MVWFAKHYQCGRNFLRSHYRTGEGPEKKIRTPELKASGHSLGVDSPSIWVVFVLGILHSHDTRSIRTKLRKLSYGLT